MTKSATDNDIENIEAWAEVIEDMLRLAAPDIRSSVLALATKNEDAERTRRELSGGFSIVSAAEVMLNRNINAIMRLKGLLIQVFVRDVTSDNSPEDAASILFAHQKHGHGSGLLCDYLGGLPGLTAQPKKERR